MALIAGCDSEGDAVSIAEQADLKARIVVPGIAETRAIPEEAFIYGLPIVMNYPVMNEFCADKNSGHCKGPLNPMNHAVSPIGQPW